MNAISLILLFLSPAASAQDLFERFRRDEEAETITTSEYRGKDRLDLRLSADATQFRRSEESKSSRLGVSGYLDYDFACGRFDVRTNLQHLLSREAREDFLQDAVDALLAQMAHNSMVLICETSPTVCQALQHYRISANAMLGMQYDWCQAVESAVDDSIQSTRAKAIKDCIDEKRAQGKSLDEAREACETPDKIRGLDGRFVSEINLTDEIRRAFNLPKADEDILVQLISSLRYSPNGGEGEIQATAVLNRHQELVEKYGKAWENVIAAIHERRELSADDLSALSPDKAGRISPAEVADIAALPAARRDVVLRSVVSSAALFQLSVEVGKVAKLLDAARKHPTADQGFVTRLEKEREDLERQLSELVALHDLQERHNRTLLEANAVAHAEILTKGTRSVLAEHQKKESQTILRRTPRWGTFPEKTSNPNCCDVPQSTTKTTSAPQWGSFR